MARPGIVNIFPEGGTRCTSITLLVEIDYLRPFTAPGEWDYENILAWALNNRDDATVNANCIAHIPWVELEPVQYKINQTIHMSTDADEREYRIHCESQEEQPSREGFWLFVLRDKHGIVLL